MKYKSPEINKIDPIQYPCKKTTYSSVNEANESIEYLKVNKWVKELSAYKCTICGLWHLTSK